MTPEQLKKAVRAFSRALLDHEQPLDPAIPDEKALYVEDIHQHKSHGVNLNPVEQLAEEIDEAAGTRVWLFTGNIGCGKSTELRQLRKLLKQQGHAVLLFDLDDYLNINQPVQIGDFLISLTGGIAESAADAVGEKTLTDLGYWQRLWNFLIKTQVELTEINIGDDKAGLKLALKNDPVIKSRLQSALAGHVASLHRELSDYLASSVFSRVREGNQHRKIVILVDSLEKMRGIGGDGAKVFSSVLDMFSEFHDLLRFENTQIVYSVAPYMLKLRPQLGALYGNASIVHLTSLHIFKKRSQSLDDQGGMPGVREIVRRRYPDYAALIPDPVLDRVIEYSGGDLRDLFRLLRLVLSVLDKAESVEAAFEYAKAQMRRDMTWLSVEELARLRTVHNTHDPVLIQDKDRDLLVQDLELKRVLMYRNGEDWYDIHPLLREKVMAPAQPGADGE